MRQQTVRGGGADLCFDVIIEMITQRSHIPIEPCPAKAEKRWAKWRARHAENQALASLRSLNFHPRYHSRCKTQVSAAASAAASPSHRPLRFQLDRLWVVRVRQNMAVLYSTAHETARGETEMGGQRLVEDLISTGEQCRRQYCHP